MTGTYLLTSSGSSSLPTWSTPMMFEEFTIEQHTYISMLMRAGYSLESAYARTKADFNIGDKQKVQPKKEEAKMCNKFYKVIKDNYLYDEGAILKHTGGDAYRPINGSDLWNKEHTTSELCINEKIVENSPEWFEKVYLIKSDSGEKYTTKENAKALFEEGNKEV